MTNADRIRAMSDEELASFLAEKFVDSCRIMPTFAKEIETATQRGLLEHIWRYEWIKWLKQPVEEDSECAK